MKRILLNPGPVTITETVRQSLMQPDNCHREKEIKNKITFIRKNLVSLAGGTLSEYSSVLFVSSGTGAVEAVMSSIVSPREANNLNPEYSLIISNGAYGERMIQMAETLGINFVPQSQKWGTPIQLDVVKRTLQTGIFSHIFIVHHETTTGILNPIKEIGELAKQHGCTYVVDAISSFGGVPIDVKECNIDFLIGTANKCIQGVPGVAFVIGRIEEIEATKNINRSVYFNLYDEWKHQEDKEMFRFTSPVQVIYGLERAIIELKQETIEHRYQRYIENYNTLKQGFCNDLGFELFPTETPSMLLATFNYPENFNFNEFHDKLLQKGFVIYPGKLKDEKTFRIAVMGDIRKKEVELFLEECKKILKEEK